MISGLRVLALVPARQGSKGIHNKNLRLVGGVSLTGRAVLCGVRSQYVDYTFVSTDSSAIAREGIKYGGAVPFLRPSYLASDKAKTIDSVVYSIDALSRIGESFDILVLLQPTSPLRTSEQVDRALELFLQSGQKGVVSVVEERLNPFLLRTIDANHHSIPFVKTNSTIRRQDIPVFFRVNGAIYINLIRDITSQLSFNDNPIAFEMSEDSSVDVDEMEDLVKARSIARNNKF